MTTNMVGKGTGNGQAIRDEILHIMHRHKISERAGHFYEQWHQKLHNNTTPEDIPICEALLAYLKSGGNMSEYWRVLTDAGINRERLASYERKITEEPWYKPEAISDFENYLQILKRVHSSDDLNHLIGDVWHKVGADTHGLLKDLQSNFKDHDVVRQLGRVYNLRANLYHHHYDMNNTAKLKDVMFLDLALEAYARTLTERIMHIDIGYEGYIHEVTLLLKNLALSFKWEELGYLKDDWQNIVVTIGKNLTEDNARRVKSVIDRVKSALAEVNEVIETVMQKKAETMGYAFRAQDWSVKLFSEEVLRGTLFFSLSMILKKIDPHVRQCAHLGDWLIISNGRAHGSRGYVEYVPRLADVMHKTYEKRTVLMVDKITGEEEVPENVQAIILMNSADYPDVLAHVSVRARNLKVLLSVLFDESRYKDLKGLVGKHLKLDVANQVVQYQQ
jgi:alpha-glucan,water dikinase